MINQPHKVIMRPRCHNVDEKHPTKYQAFMSLALGFLKNHMQVKNIFNSLKAHF